LADEGIASYILTQGVDRTTAIRRIKATHRSSVRSRRTSTTSIPICAWCGGKCWKLVDAAGNASHLQRIDPGRKTAVVITHERRRVSINPA
jgi:hypothetical protein